MICCFRGDYDFLSNFFPTQVVLDGESYPTVEHAFQAAKTIDLAEREPIRQARSPGRAKKLGRQLFLRLDWEEVKVDIMRDLLEQKFRDPELRRRLLLTGTEELVEGNTWGDRFWGCVEEDDRWVGRNQLGKLLMAIREDIRPKFAPELGHFSG